MNKIINVETGISFDDEMQIRKEVFEEMKNVSVLFTGEEMVDTCLKGFGDLNTVKKNVYSDYQLREVISLTIKKMMENDYKLQNKGLIK